MMQSNFIRKHKKEMFLCDTPVENVFISEYMAVAPGEFAKVYLYASMYAELESEISNEEIAKQLSIAEEDVLKAWSYWEGLGVIRKHFIDPKNRFTYQVEFLNLKELLYGKKTRSKAGKGSEHSEKAEETKILLADGQIKEMYAEVEKAAGRMLSGKEPMEIISWITDFNAEPKLVVFAYDYCTKHRKKNNPQYVGKVVKEWIMSGMFTVEAVEKHVEETENRHFLYKRVMKSLGFMRNATEEEKRHMDNWFDKMNFSVEKVLEACGKTAGIPNPNMNYVNKILENWYNGNDKPKGEKGKAGTSKLNIGRYYDKIREEAEKSAVEKKNQVYSEIPRIKEIDEEMRSCGMQLSRIMVSKARDAKAQTERLREHLNGLEAERAILLTENNYTLDCMDVNYKCQACKDTGTNDLGERCSCFPERLSEAEIWQNSLKEF